MFFHAISRKFPAKTTSQEMGSAPKYKSLDAVYKPLK